MKKLLTHSRNLAVPVLLASSACAFGQSLGQASGELWIGRPLDITIPARFASADSHDTCVHADVVYGDTRLAPERIHTTVLGADENRRVRITSDQVVDEPLVRVTLRAGCGSTMTRTYTMLPDMPSEAVLARLMQDPPARAQALAVAAPAAPVTSMLAARADARPAGLRLIPAVARLPAREGRPLMRAFRPAAVPRLHLDAIEADARSLLRVSASLSQPGDAALRAKAALLWQAISADPQDLVRSTAALQKLENDLAQLRQTAGSTRAEMASLRRRIDEAQPWYLAPRMVQGLALLVLATAGAVGVLAWRTRRASDAIPWYTPSDHAPLEPQGIEAAAPIAEMPAPPVAQPRTERAMPLQPTSVERTLAPEPVAGTPQPAALPPLDFQLEAAEPPPPARPRPASSGLLRVETLAATLEEVEFLVSLGLHSDAMDVLKAYLEDSASPAPVAFFELMRVCSLAEDPQAVEAVRRRYAKVQGVAAPTVEQVAAAGGLAQQRALADRITRAWGTPEVVVLIEQALFDAPPPSAPLTVDAARDLICLYDVAVLLATEVDGAPDDDDHPLAPWAHAEHVDEAHAYAQAVAEDIGGHRFALDIDLTVVPQALPEKAREPGPAERAAAAQAEQESARKAAERAAAEAEDAFNAAVALERAPISRY